MFLRERMWAKASIVGVITVVIAIGITLLLFLEESLFYTDVFNRSTARLIWEIINIFAVLAIAAFGSVGGAFFILVIQWFLIGTFGSAIYQWFRFRTNKHI